MKTVSLLFFSNIFVTLAWYGHLENLNSKPLMQEVIAMVVYAGVATLHMREPLKLDSLWTGLCLVGASYFMFRAAQRGRLRLPRPGPRGAAPPRRSGVAPGDQWSCRPSGRQSHLQGQSSFRVQSLHLH